MSARDEHGEGSLSGTNIPSGANWFAVAVAGILMLATTVVLIAVLYNWDPAIRRGGGKDFPTCSLACSYHEEGFFIIEVTNIDIDTAVNGVEFYLEDEDGEDLEMGEVEEVYGQDMFFFPHNLSFVDRETDFYVGSGDYFILRSSGNGGLAQSGQKFRLVHYVTGDTIGSCRLTTTEGVVNTSLPRTQWNVTVQDEQNISLDESQPAASQFSSSAHFHPGGSGLLFSLVFENVGDVSRDLTLVLREENTTLSEQHHETVPGESVSFSFNHTGDVDDEDYFFSKTYYLNVLDSETNETLLSGELCLVFCRYYPAITPSFSTTTTIQLITFSLVFCATVAKVRKKRRS